MFSLHITDCEEIHGNLWFRVTQLICTKKPEVLPKLPYKVDTYTNAVRKTNKSSVLLGK